MERLRRLDESVTHKGAIISIIVGIVGMLIIGFGMCLCLEWDKFIPRVIIVVVGMAILVAAYPIYSKITQKQREKIAPEILRLTDEISNEK